MSDAVDALVTWKDESKGGRKILPPWLQYHYMAPVEFENARKPITEEAWDLVVELLEPAQRNIAGRARVRFAADGAPKELLRPGSRFRLLDGPRLSCVAEGVIVD